MNIEKLEYEKTPEKIIDDALTNLQEEFKKASNIEDVKYQEVLNLLFEKFPDYIKYIEKRVRFYFHPDRNRDNNLKFTEVFKLITSFFEETNKVMLEKAVIENDKKLVKELLSQRADIYFSEEDYIEENRVITEELWFNLFNLSVDDVIEEYIIKKLFDEIGKREPADLILIFNAFFYSQSCVNKLLYYEPINELLNKRDIHRNSVLFYALDSIQNDTDLSSNSEITFIISNTTITIEDKEKIFKKLEGKKNQFLESKNLEKATQIEHLKYRIDAIIFFNNIVEETLDEKYYNTDKKDELVNELVENFSSLKNGKPEISSTLITCFEKFGVIKKREHFLKQILDNVVIFLHKSFKATPLEKAVLEKDEKLVKELLSQRADIYFSENDYIGENCIITKKLWLNFFHLSDDDVIEEYDEIIKEYIVKKLFDEIKIRTPKELILIFNALFYNKYYVNTFINYETIKLLLNKRDTNGNNVLFYALDAIQYDTDLGPTSEIAFIISNTTTTVEDKEKIFKKLEEKKNQFLESKNLEKVNQIEYMEYKINATSFFNSIVEKTLNAGYYNTDKKNELVNALFNKLTHFEFPKNKKVDVSNTLIACFKEFGVVKESKHFWEYIVDKVLFFLQQNLPFFIKKAYEGTNSGSFIHIDVRKLDNKFMSEFIKKLNHNNQEACFSYELKTGI